MKYYSESITNLIEELASLPNIGPKSAQRLALHILNLPEARVKHLADSILTAKQKICFCKECFNLSDRELCQVCADEKRDHQTIMVVEEPSDLAAYEKTGQYKGVYHVLHGAVNPMVGVKSLFIDDMAVLAFFLGQIECLIRLAHQFLVFASIYRILRYADRSCHMGLRIKCQSKFLRNGLQKCLQLFSGLHFLQQDHILVSAESSDQDRKSTRLNSSHRSQSRMPSSA